MGTDLDVVDAARVSFNKISEWDVIEHPESDKEFGGGGANDDWYELKLKKEDARLIAYLAKHNHWTPFSHVFLKFRVKAPIPVARQLQKHTVGGAWNEVSRRYVSYTPEIFNPTDWRAKAANKKQGSSDTRVELERGHVFDEREDLTCYEHAVHACLDAYEDLLRQGVCEEQARFVLPQGATTEWIWSGSLAFFLRVVKLRTDPSSQLETRAVAAKIESSLRSSFPVSASAFLD
jgi:thymidylate synthase (FAD)